MRSISTPQEFKEALQHLLGYAVCLVSLPNVDDTDVQLITGANSYSSRVSGYVPSLHDTGYTGFVSLSFEDLIKSIDNGVINEACGWVSWDW